LSRIRYQTELRPRIASTSTSAGSRRGHTAGCRAFHRSRPAIASSLVAARATSISGIVLRRRPVGPLALPGAGAAAAPRAPAASARRLDGCTRGASPTCFS